MIMKRGNPALRAELAREVRLYRSHILVTEVASLRARNRTCRGVIAHHLARDTEVSRIVRRSRPHARG